MIFGGVVIGSNSKGGGGLRRGAGVVLCGLVQCVEGGVPLVIVVQIKAHSSVLREVKQKMRSNSSGTFNKVPSEKGTFSKQKTFFQTPFL